MGQEKLGKENDEVIKAMGAFGGGLGGCGETCGAVIGALGIIGELFSRAREDEKENPQLWAYTHEMVDKFRNEIVKKHPGILCRDIAQVDWANREEAKAFYRGEKVQECARLVGETARVLGELIEKAQKESQ